MPVNIDESGRRWVQAEVEVSGTPEEVWQAIATGPGISSWFVPTKLEEREGGETTSCFGPGMDSLSTIKVWDPPRRFVADSRDDMGPGDPTIATEWTVEARKGGTCIVRVVHSWHTDADTWDAQFEGHTHGWRVFFRILRLYLAHFSGRPSSAFQLMGVSSEPQAEAWSKLAQALGMTELAEGDRFQSPVGVPTLTGVAERVGSDAHPEVLLRLDQPTNGLAHLFAMSMGGMTYLPVRLYLYGDQASKVATQVEPNWQEWLQQLFPAPAAESEASN